MKCCDCEKEISKTSKRCKSCANINRTGTYKLSTKGKLNIGLSRKGQQAWNKGLNHNKDIRIKIKSLNNIKFKKYGMRQEEWILFSKRIRQKVGECQICKFNESINSLDIHHIVPYSISQENSKNNLLIVCKSCHQKIHYHLMKDRLWVFNNVH